MLAVDGDGLGRLSDLRGVVVFQEVVHVQISLSICVLSCVLDVAVDTSSARRGPQFLVLEHNIVILFGSVHNFRGSARRSKSHDSL